jgi:hypothetical protein
MIVVHENALPDGRTEARRDQSRDSLCIRVPVDDARNTLKTKFSNQRCKRDKIAW